MSGHGVADHARPLAAGQTDVAAGIFHPLRLKGLEVALMTFRCLVKECTITCCYILYMTYYYIVYMIPAIPFGGGGGGLAGLDHIYENMFTRSIVQIV